MKGQALRRIYYEMKTKKSTLSKACNAVADEILSFWIKANIATTAKTNIVSKLKKLHEDHIKASKNRKRQSEAQITVEDDFTENLTTLFDIAHAEWEHLTRIPDDRMFLIDQRGPRLMVMTTEDMNFRQAAAKYIRRQKDEENRQVRHLQQKAEPSHSGTAESLAVHNSSSDEEDDGDKLFKPAIRAKRPLLNQSLPVSKRRIIENPQFNAALDRTGTTSRQAMMIVTPALAAAGVDVNEFTLSRTSLMQARNESREALAKTVRESFQPDVPLVAHFDSKLLQQQDGSKNDALAIVVSGMNIEKLLGIPILPSGSGTLMGRSVYDLVLEWPGVEEHLGALCFDTTSSNTGIHTGAITVIQQYFDRRLLFLACRHHMFEIYAASAFDLFFKSSGPEIELFRRFRSKWQLIDTSKFCPLDGDNSGPGSLNENEQRWLASRRAVVVESLKQQLENAQPRDDYREFARLVLWMLGEDVSSAFSPPGAYHRARWMAKGIYCLKIFGFRHQFKLTKHETESLRRICLFVCTIYASYWFSAPEAALAPMNDLTMLQVVEDYQKIDGKVAGVVEKKMRLHLWYISEDLAALPLFANDVSVEIKEAILVALQREPNIADVRRLAPTKIASFKERSVADFVTSRSLNLFDALGFSKGFLKKSLSTWSTNEDYIRACRIVSTLKVVNDGAERAVKLASDFNEILTKSDDQRQLLYQVVEYHRKLVPTNVTKQLPM